MKDARADRLSTRALRSWSAAWLSVAVMMMAACRDGCDSTRDASSPQSRAAAERPPRPPLPGLQAIPLRTGKDAESLNLQVGLDGSVWVSWLEPAAEAKHALAWSRLHEGQWSPAATVLDSGSLFVNWADVPTITANMRGHVVATWLEYARDGAGYGVKWSRSIDGGTSWSDAELLSDHRGGPEYGFVSFAGTPTGDLAVFWLDGRESHGHGAGQMQLRGAVIDAEGRVRDRRLLDERVCDCCQTAAAATSVGPVVVYRDRGQDEVRDIRIAGPGLEENRAVAADDWKIAGCPVNGPAVAALGDRLAVAWFTAAADEPRVQVAFSSADGSFGAPIRIDLGKPIGRVAIAWLDAEDVAVSFLERNTDDETQADLLVRRTSPVGRVGAPAVVARTSASPSAGFPRMVRVDDRLSWAWIQADGPEATVRLAEAPLEAVPG